MGVSVNLEHNPFPYQGEGMTESTINEAIVLLGIQRLIDESGEVYFLDPEEVLVNIHKLYAHHRRDDLYFLARLAVLSGTRIVVG